MGGRHKRLSWLDKLRGWHRIDMVRYHNWCGCVISG